MGNPFGSATNEPQGIPPLQLAPSERGLAWEVCGDIL